MAIPHDDIIQDELLSLIAYHPDKRILAKAAYAKLAELHPELTHKERTERYRHSVSQWANRVQFARLHLVNQGFIYKSGANQYAGTGYWAITPEGEEKAKELTFLNRIQEQVAADLDSLAFEEQLEEGGKTIRLTAFYERNSELRATAIRLHKTTCKACGFNFANVYGEHGKDYIEVHHLVPISTYIEPKTINPATDLTVLCSNCHRMIHRKKDRPLSVDDLIKIIKKNTHQ